MNSASLNSPVSRNLQTRKRNVLLIFFAVSFVIGFAEVALSSVAGEGAYQIFSLLALVFNTVLLVYWFVLDAREREFNLNRNWIFGLVVIMFLVAPVYFFRTRGKRFVLPCMWGVLCLLLYGVCFALGVSLAELCGFEPLNLV